MALFLNAHAKCSAVLPLWSCWSRCAPALNSMRSTLLCPFCPPPNPSASQPPAHNHTPPLLQHSHTHLRSHNQRRVSLHVRSVHIHLEGGSEEGKGASRRGSEEGRGQIGKGRRRGGDQRMGVSMSAPVARGESEYRPGPLQKKTYLPVFSVQEILHVVDV
eukprot:2699291-Rhodomonas_salina.1